MKKQIHSGAFRRLVSLMGVVAMLVGFALLPTAVHSLESEENAGQTQTVTFDASADKQLFKCYSSSMGSFSVKNGQLTPTGTSGEFKAIYKDEGARYESVSVELYPGSQGINGGLYINASDPAHGREKITALGVMVQSNHTGWEDAPNRIDLIICAFPGWTELQRTISETGAGNALFSGGVKEALKLKVDISGNMLTVTLSLLSDATKFISTTYTHSVNEDLGLGDVGIRSDMCNGAFDNFTMVTAAPDDTEPEPSEPEIMEPTDLVTFEGQEMADKFDFYHSTNDGFAVQDGKLVPSGATGELKAVYKDTNASFQAVSVDLYPGLDGINSGIYLDVTQAAHPENQITGLVVMVESNMNGWADAVNRADIVVGAFPQWKELHRVITETGNGNALFAGEKAPVNLTVAIDGNKLTITLRRLDDPGCKVTTTYICADYSEIALGNVGLRSQRNTAAFDNFSVIYTTVEADKEPDVVIPEPEPPTDLVDFETSEAAGKFDFYKSSNGGLVVADGKLKPFGEDGEFKAIYRDGGATIQSVSVDLYPGENGINSGLYIGTSTVEDGADRIRGLVVMVESNMSGWDDAVNRIDIVIGRFPIWKELHRYTSETGAGNALFAGSKEPVNLRVDIDGMKLTVTLSLLSDPSRYVTTVYEYTGATPLAKHNVGLRSAYNDVSFDNFAVYSTTGGGSEDKKN